MSDLKFSESILVAAAPQVVYDMVSDVTRMGEWSPVCTSCWWDDGAGPTVGAWFTGRNELPERTWETRSQVAAAERGREFTFVVGGTFVRWSYTMSPADGGTRLTESWEFLPEGIAMFEQRFSSDAPAQIADRAESARRTIPLTLAAIQRAAQAPGDVPEGDGAPT